MNKGRVSVDELSRQGLLKVAGMLYSSGRDWDGTAILDDEILNMPTDELREMIRADIADGSIGLVRVDRYDPHYDAKDYRDE